MIKIKQISLLSLLTGLTFLFVFAQVYLFIDHYKLSNLIDSLVTASIALQLLHPVILLPIMGFVLLQITAYVLFVSVIWFIATTFGEWFNLAKSMTTGLGVLIWCMACFAMLELNHIYYPDSLFANLMSRLSFVNQHGEIILITILSILLMMTVMSYLHFFWFKRYRWSGSVILLCIVGVLITALYDLKPLPVIANHTQPNIIIIGLDSLRPDFTGFYGNKTVHTPNIDHFLEGAMTFSSAYTPLARTYPAWMSILTAKYPRHNEARNNLIDPVLVIKNDTLARKLQQSGYTTIYATDEKRFSNITKDYGFDRILGPRMGVNDFLLGGLSDFPLSNLLVNIPPGRFLFPYNYGNRAATITYQPDKFLQLIKMGLADLPDKPVFLSIHLCLSHWPHTWADKGHTGSVYISSQYRRSVNAVDKQLGALMQLLQESGLLRNSWVVVLSDHGTALGLPHDRIITEDDYQGDKQKMNIVPALKLSSQPHGNNKPVYSVNTAYGQGTNILSLTQNHVLLAFQRHGGNLPRTQINELASLLDIAPTLLDVLSLSPLTHVDGISLREYFSDDRKKTAIPRAFFMETGDTMSEIETDHIYIEKVIKHEIGIYGIHPATGLLTMNAPATQSIIKNKQLAIMRDNWILAHFPISRQKKRVIPPYFVLVNIKTGQWTVELDSSFAQSAPVKGLMQQLKEFYGEEISGIR